MVGEYKKIVPKYQTKPCVDAKVKMKHSISIGDKFGRLTVLYRIDDKVYSDGKRYAMFHCLCGCGCQIDVLGISLQDGSTKSCGCLLKEVNSKKVVDLTGEKIGLWTVLGRADDIVEKNGRRRVAWKCRCECGAEKVIRGNALTGGKSLSCGCLRRLQRESDCELYNLQGRQFGMLHVISRTDDIIDKRGWHHAAWLCKCSCGHICVVSSYQLCYDGIQSCGCVKSHGELKIGSILTSHHVIFTKEYSFDDLVNKATGRRLRYDFAIFKDNNLSYIIEYDGEQHFSDTTGAWVSHVEDVRKRDTLKDLYCFSHNIPLIRIPYTRFNDLVYEDLVPETTNYLLLNPAA